MQVIYFQLACSRLSVSGGLIKRAGDEWGLVGKKERSLCQWRIDKAGGRRVGSGREKGDALSFSLPDPARR